ncbi:MAG: tRNA (adenosine(37)-N6)-threonylcarbamoyltransferase complex dimerization subunit type 1 TsaB [Saprospiraceae bacterium]|nr:tRNA (adenosine(37)-N6)-threonylcarbamoyltransferase complex dimerization subunit type 1 TsaB [Saprospiraceae bacterium]
MCYILHLESSTEVCSVAISKDGQLVSEVTSDVGNAHASKITVLIQECLASAQIDTNDLSAVALSYGPGSYTGLRIGASVAKGICFSLKLPLIAISSLQAFANGAIVALANTKLDEDYAFLSMIDARRKDAYCALYDGKGRELIAPHFATIDEAYFEHINSLNRGKVVRCGNSNHKCREISITKGTIFSDVTCRATHLISIASAKFHANDFADITYFEPFYLKAPNITTPKKNILGV